jgi:hypothetical protein
MGVGDARQMIHEASEKVHEAARYLRGYLDAPMHGQTLNWDDVLNERRLLDQEITPFDELLRNGMNQEWPKPELTPG